MVERLAIRSLVAVILIAAVSASIGVPIPMDAKGRPDLPGPAFGQAGLYRLETAVLIFYGSLLLITPAFLGLIRGRLPIEISTRGAKFAEEADLSTTLNEEKIEDLERITDDLTEGLRIANFEIERLKRQPVTTHNRR